MIMYRKYFFKNEGVLSRKFIVGGLAAVFSSGIFGSYAGAMSDESFENVIEKDTLEEFIKLNFKEENYLKVVRDKDEILVWF